jgi:hypothetical protein
MEDDTADEPEDEADVDEPPVDVEGALTDDDDVDFEDRGQA